MSVALHNLPVRAAQSTGWACSAWMVDGGSGGTVQRAARSTNDGAKRSLRYVARRILGVI